jgi:hypothetical protein
MVAATEPKADSHRPPSVRGRYFCCVKLSVPSGDVPWLLFAAICTR